MAVIRIKPAGIALKSFDHHICSNIDFIIVYFHIIKLLINILFNTTMFCSDLTVYVTKVLSGQKKEYDSKLADQKNSYERIISAKDDDISNLKDTVTNLRKQQDIANDQIKELTTVTKQAQSLNLADKSPEQIKMLKGDAETSNEKSSSDKKVDSPTERPTKKHWWQF